MSNSSFLKSLEKLFFILGMFSLVVAVLGVGFTLHTQYLMSTSSWMAGLPWNEQANLLPQFKSLVSFLSDAFLAFLVSAIFAMIRTRNPDRQERTDRLMHLTCGGYAMTGLISLGSWLHWILHTYPSFECFGEKECEFMTGFMQTTSVAFMGLATLTPFIYAVTVYALYTQFARLVNFEAEVI
jgi:hypothetical protein